MTQSNNASAVSLSPSFNSYSNARLAEIAARVVEEFGPEEYYDEFYFDRGDEEQDSIKNRDSHEADDDGFEFAFSTRDSESFSPISADEIFCNGRIRTFYNERRNDVAPAVRLPLRKLFVEERETTMTMTSLSSSSSSSEGDELDGVPAETYCVWRPKAAAAEEEEEVRCEKSGSTGSISKRWKFKELLSRSHSDGGKKSGFVLLGHSSSGRRKEEAAEKEKENVKSAAAAVAAAGKVKTTAAIYGGGERRRSYLPYRQDLVGLFSGVNGLSKNLQPF